MHDQPTQRAILGLLLDAHPKLLTIPDLARETGTGDAVERAVTELLGVGLIERDEDSVRASAAAVRFDALELP